MNKKLFIFVIILALGVSVMGYGVFTYNNAVKQELEAAIHTTLIEIIAQQKYSFISTLQGEATALETYAASIVDSEATKAELILSLKRVIDKTGFVTLVIAKTDGNGMNNLGVSISISDEPTFNVALRGKTAISERLEGPLGNQKMISFATPLISDNKVQGVVYGSYEAYKLNDLFMHSFGGKGYAYILNQDGVVVARTNSKNSIIVGENQFNTFAEATFYRYDDFERVKENMARRIGGHAKYIYKNESADFHYEPLGINDWYIFSVVPTSVAGKQEDQIIFYNNLLTGVIIVVFVCFFIYMYIINKHHLRVVEKIAFVDPLTGEKTRRKFELDALELLKEPTPYSFLVFDVDKFKVLNDALGFENGDKLLKIMAKVFKENMKFSEIFGRCDSDKFHLLLRYENDKLLQARAEAIINQIQDNFKQQINSYYNLVLCVGIYVIADHSQPINIITDKARHAHRLIKGQESSSVCFYDEEMRSKILRDKIIENKMHSALADEEFQLYLQPKYFLKNLQVSGVEALVRWLDKEGNLIYPNEFIPLFEQNGFITQLDFYMLKKVCETIKNWESFDITGIPVSVNFSRLHLKNENFVADIAKIVADYGVPTNLIEIELTESTMFNNEEILIKMLNQLHSYGFTLSMDDFGSGYSSLGLLKNLPVDAIKLDKTFFSQYTDLARAKIVIANVISMAKALEISTVAEGVETQEHIDLLAGLGCDIVQGYFYAIPMSTENVETLLKVQSQIPGAGATHSLHK